MRSPLQSLVPIVVAALPVCAQNQPASSLVACLPDDAVAVVHVAEPVRALGELRQAVGAVPDNLPLALRLQVSAGLVALWAAMRGNPEAFIDRLAGGGMAIGFVPAPSGVRAVAVMRPGDLAATKTWLQRNAARAHVEVADGVIVVANAPELAAAAARAARGDAASSRWASVEFTKSAVSGVVDLRRLREVAGTKAPSLETLDAGGRFVLAPIVHALAEGEWLQLSLAGGDRLRASARVAASVRGTAFGALLADAGSEARASFGDDGVMSLRLGRSVRELLKAPERFLSAEGVQAVRGFLSIADAVDGVHSSFVDDLLGGLGEPFDLHVLPITPVADGPAPRIQLPGIVVSAPLRSPKVEAILLRMAQAFLLIANAERAQRGQAAFSARRQHDDTGHGLVAEPAPWRRPGAPAIEQGLSPTLWFGNGIVALGSTAAAAKAVVARAGSSVGGAAGDDVVLRGSALAEVIVANRSAIEFARTLDEGEDRPAAAGFVDALLAITAAVREARLRSGCDAASTWLELTVERAR